MDLPGSVWTAMFEGSWSEQFSQCIDPRTDAVHFDAFMNSQCTWKLFQWLGLSESGVGVSRTDPDQTLGFSSEVDCGTVCRFRKADFDQALSPLLCDWLSLWLLTVAAIAPINIRIWKRWIFFSRTWTPRLLPECFNPKLPQLLRTIEAY